MKERWVFVLTGRVQAVGLRYKAKRLAKNYPLTGWVTNRPDGTVELQLQGDPAEIMNYMTELRHLPGILLTDVQAEEIPVERLEVRFKIKTENGEF